MDLTPEEVILEDIKQWCEIHLFDGTPWDDHLAQYSPKEIDSYMEEIIEIYWQDHIFPIDRYIQNV